MIFFIRYILYLHFKWFPLSWIPSSQKSHKPPFLPLFPNHPLPISLSWYSPVLLRWAFPGPGASPSFFLGIIWYVNCFLGITSCWANICLSVSGYHVCSFRGNDKIGKWEGGDWGTGGGKRAYGTFGEEWSGKGDIIWNVNKEKKEKQNKIK